MIEISEDEYLLHCQNDDGVCLACGEFTCGGVEPDAESYECEACGAKSVCGTENALVMGELDFV
jgi:hypothetical protein